MGGLHLFYLSFLSATLLPGGSEIYFVYLASMDYYGQYSGLFIVAVASAGNILGGGFNYFLGRKFRQLLKNRFTGFSDATLEKARQRIDQYGGIAIFFSFLPVIGDPVTAAAGLVGYRFHKFVFFLALGKTLRYVVLYVLASGINPQWIHGS